MTRRTAVGFVTGFGMGFAGFMALFQLTVTGLGAL